jgi:hypothetical protein
MHLHFKRFMTISLQRIFRFACRRISRWTVVNVAVSALRRNLSKAMLEDCAEKIFQIVPGRNSFIPLCMLEAHFKTHRIFSLQLGLWPNKALGSIAEKQ